jgi:hypothetical protein
MSYFKIIFTRFNLKYKLLWTINLLNLPYSINKPCGMIICVIDVVGLLVNDHYMIYGYFIQNVIYLAKFMVEMSSYRVAVKLYLLCLYSCALMINFAKDIISTPEARSESCLALDACPQCWPKHS